MAWLVPILGLLTMPSVSSLPAWVYGRELIVDGKAVVLKGVNWNPVRKGTRKGWKDVDFRGFVEADSVLMEVAGINVVRTYEPILDVEVLDVLWQKGIQVLNTAYVADKPDHSSILALVNKLKDHPAMLMWVIGNEWNYNGLYSDLSEEEATAHVDEISRMIKKVDSNHPVATVYGQLPGPEQLAALPAVDVWGVTAYDGLTFGKLFDNWAILSKKPMFLAEFGADAYNAKTQSLDEGDQAVATVALTNEIVTHSTHNGGVCIGGFLFELADEWWKDVQGSPDSQDVGGAAPGAGPFPDDVFNEEYWGIVSIDGTTREAYRAYAALDVPGASRHTSTIAAPSVTAGYRLRACGSSAKCSGILGNCCPFTNGSFHSCCSHSSGTESKAVLSKAGGAKSLQGELEKQVSTTSAGDLGKRSHRQAKDVFTDSSSFCAINAPVKCCSDGACATCAGDQCCPSAQGSVTCPSASAAHTGCMHPKEYDCTGETGTMASSQTDAVVRMQRLRRLLSANKPAASEQASTKSWWSYPATTRLVQTFYA